MRHCINCALFAILAFLGVAAKAQEAAISAEKQAPIKTTFPGSYGKLELRHSVARRMDGDSVTNDVPKLDVRPTLGSTFFDGKFDTSFTWIFRKTADSTKISKLILFNESKWTVLQGRYGDIGPYAVTYQSNDQSFSESYVGFDANLKKDVPITTGILALKGYMQPLAVLQSGKNSSDHKVNVRNDTGNDGFALDGGGNTEIEQRDPTLWNYSGAEAQYKPSVVQGLYVGLGVELSQKWQPKYVAKSVDNETRVEMDGYEATSLTTNVFKLGYKMSKTMTVAGAIRQNIGGYYEQGVGETKPDPTGYWGPTRWESRLALQATLF